MSPTLSPNTKAILLLTAPLIVAAGKRSDDLLTPGEYKKLARRLRELGAQPADLMNPNSEPLRDDCESVVAKARLERLLARGFLLSQAVERWQARSIWVISRADAAYPQRLKSRLKTDSPALLYGCGDPKLFDRGGLAVVGSRHVDDALIEYTQAIGRLVASAGQTVVSGGARGVDQAAMEGALDADGTVVGALANGLEKAALTRGYRDALMAGRLLLFSSYDPAARFLVGHAMQRNKLIYALSDAALVVNSSCGSGGTWTGAVEQLEKLQFVPIYVRADPGDAEGLQALRRKGALDWPAPQTPAEFKGVLDTAVSRKTNEPRQAGLFSSVEKLPKPYASTSPAETLFAKVRELLKEMENPKTDSEVAEQLDVGKGQAKVWLQRLVEEGALEKLSRPVRYRSLTRSRRVSGAADR